jgi:hypothetical protein
MIEIINKGQLYAVGELAPVECYNGLLRTVSARCAVCDEKFVQLFGVRINTERFNRRCKLCKKPGKRAGVLKPGSPGIPLT